MKPKQSESKQSKPEVVAALIIVAMLLLALLSCRKKENLQDCWQCRITCGVRQSDTLICNSAQVPEIRDANGNTCAAQCYRK
jgi:hypothetical protein